MFRNAWNLGEISGIKVRVHWSFLIIPALMFFTAISDGRGLLYALGSVALVLAFFFCVLLHEFGHAFAALQFGIGTRDILLLPIGGVASLERMPRKPWQELWIAVAGPLVNVVIAIAIFAGLAIFAATGISPITVERTSPVKLFLFNLMLGNLLLVAFNMVPAFPMDGGRVLRSVMAMFLPYARATVIAATVGKWCALTFVIYSLFSYGLFSFTFMMNAMLAGFVYLAGQAEKFQVLMAEQGRAAGFQGRNPFGNQQQSRPSFQHANQATGSFDSGSRPNTGDAASGNEISVPSTLSGDSAVAWLGSKHAEICSVVESGRVIGRITKSQLLSALASGLGSMPIGQILSHSR